MQPLKRRQILSIILALLLLITLACSFSINIGDEATQNDVALEYVQVDEAPKAEEDKAEEEQSLPQSVTHVIVPGNPGRPLQEKEDVDSSNTADDKLALGDSLRLGNLERPFTAETMLYHPETDLILISVGEDDDFFYFTIEMNAVSADNQFLDAGYGVEFDTDYDGRGDVLLWAMGDGNTTWNTDAVYLLKDENEDVGGVTPVVPDAYPGDGYETVLFSAAVMTDVDAAWKRQDPEHADRIQLAVKRGHVGSSRFYWKAWSDKGLRDFGKFDYNDIYSEGQAGSPNKNSAYYPLAGLHLMDSTCWAAYKLEPTGTEVGGCVVAPSEPVCDCSRPRVLNYECCTICDYFWWDGVCVGKAKQIIIGSE